MWTLAHKRLIAWSTAVVAAVVAALAVGQIELVEIGGLIEWGSEAARESCLEVAVAADGVSRDWSFLVSSFCLYRVPGFILGLQSLPRVMLVGAPIMLAAFLILWGLATVIGLPAEVIRRGWSGARRRRQSCE